MAMAAMISVLVEIHRVYLKYTADVCIICPLVLSRLKAVLTCKIIVAV